MPDYISTEEAAKVSGFHIAYIRQLARTGKLQADKKGNAWWIYRDDLTRYLKEMKALGSDKHNWRQ